MNAFECNPAEEKLEEQERCLVIAPWQVVCDRLGRTIREHHTLVVSEKGVTNRRLDADTGGTASDDQVGNPELFEDRIEVGLHRSRCSGACRQHRIASMRRKLRENVGVPGVADQRATG